MEQEKLSIIQNEISKIQLEKNNNEEQVQTKEDTR